MKKTRTIQLLSLFLILGLLSALAVSTARAQPLSVDPGAAPADNTLPAAHATRVYDPALFSAAWGIAPDSMINCDPDNDLLLRLKPGQARSTNSLQSGACRRQAAKDAALLRSVMVEASAGDGAPVAAAASASAASASSSFCGSGFGVSGEGRTLKISSGFSETRYVFLRCGKKVGESGPPTCSCNPGFRYGYSCVKPPTVYITLPCR